MAESIKLKNNKYIDSSSIAHRRKSLKEILDSPINTVLVPVGIPVTDTIVELNLARFTIKDAGAYIITSSVPLNFYGATGRELYVKLKVNGTEEIVVGGVINASTFTLCQNLTTICNVPENAQIDVTVQNSLAGANFAVSPFGIKYLKLK